MGFFQYGQVVMGTATTAAAGGTTILTNTSKQEQFLSASGSNSQTYQLPDATTMTVGQWFEFYNNSNGTLTINNNGGTTLYTVNPSSSLVVKLANNGTANGTWSSLSSGTAASGGSKNYLSSIITANGTNNLSGNFESGSTSSFSLAHSSLTSGFPSTVGSAGNAFSSAGGAHGGSAANANLSLSIVSSGQLAGTYSASYASTTATTAGDMVISNAFFIDTEDQAKIMQFSIAYTAHSNASNGNFSGTSSNSFGVAIYDVTNAAWIMPAGVYNFVQSSGVGLATGTFQTTSNSTQYQIAVYNVNATSGAITMYFDDFSVGPQIIQKGPAASDWSNSLTFSPNNFGTVTNNNIYWRRVGDSLHARGYFTTGTLVSATASISLPSGYTFDSTKAGTGTNAGQVGVFFGQTSSGTAAGLGGGNWVGAMFYDGSDTSKIYMGTQTQSGAFVKNQASGIASNNSFVSLEFVIPISGWSSNSVMSSDTDTRVVAMSANTSTTSIATGSGSTVIFTNTAYDTHAGYNSSTGIYTVPVSGYYRVSSSIRLGSLALTTAQNFQINLQKNSSTVDLMGLVYGNGTSNSYVVSGTATVLCNAGDTLNINAANSNTSTALAGGSTTQYFDIERVSGPAVITATDTVAAAYYMSTNQTPGTNTQINFDTKDYDTTNSVTTGAGAWKFTAPVTGIYSVKLVVNSNSTSTTNYNLYKNGSSLKKLTASTLVLLYSGSADVKLVAGDFIDIRPDNSIALLGTSAPYVTHVSIARIGN